MLIKEKENILYLSATVILTGVLFGINISAQSMTWSQDVWFHLSRIHEINVALSHGQLPSMVNFNSFSSVGQAVNAMYPNGTLILLVWMTQWLSPISQYFAIMVIPILVGSVCTYVVAKRIGASSFQAFAFSMMISSLMRPQFNNVQTSLSMIFTTYAIILSFYALILMSKSFNISAILLLSIAVSLVVNTHILSTILLVLYLIVLTLYFWHQSVIKVDMLKQIGIAALISIILSAYSLYNIFVMMGNKVTQPFNFKLINGTLNLDNLFSSAINWQYSTSFSLFSLMALFIICIKWHELTTTIRYLSIISGGLILLMTALVPWGALQNSLFSIIQFPTRFMVFTNVTLLIVLLLIIIKYGNNASNWLMIFLSILIIGNRIVNNWQYRQESLVDLSPKIYHRGVFDLMKSSRISNSIIRRDDFFELRKYPEYLPQQSLVVKSNRNSLLKPDSQQMRTFNHEALNQGTLIRGKKLASTANSVTYSFDKVKSGELGVPFFAFTNLNYQIQVNNKISNYKKNDRGTLNVHIKNSGEQVIKVSLIQPLVVKLLWVIGLIGWSVTFIVLLLPKHKLKLKSNK